MKEVIELFSKETIKKFGIILIKFTDIFIKPIKTWKRIISSEDNSFELFTFCILVYYFFFYLVLNDSIFALKYWMSILFFTLQPFCIYIIPFLFFRKIFKLNIEVNRLFRLIVVFGVQLFPLMYIPILIANEFDIETPYIIHDNSYYLGDILLLFVLPLLIEISWKKRIIWIITNYLFSSVFIILMSQIFAIVPEYRMLIDKLGGTTPSEEFTVFDSKYSKSDYELNDNYFIVWYDMEKDLISTQFASKVVLNKLIEFDTLRLKKAEQKSDEIAKKFIANKGDAFTYEELINEVKSKIDIEQIIEDEKISLSVFKKSKSSFNKKFENDLQLTDSLRKYAAFRENKNLCAKIYNYMCRQKALYSDSIFIRKVILNTNPKRFYTTENTIVCLYQIPSKNSIKEKDGITRLYSKLVLRYTYSVILHYYLYYPAELLESKL